MQVEALVVGAQAPFEVLETLSSGRAKFDCIAIVSQSCFRLHIYQLEPDGSIETLSCSIFQVVKFRTDISKDRTDQD